MTLPIDIAAERFPDRLAFDDGTKQITYGDLPGLIVSSQVFERLVLPACEHVAWCPCNDLQSFVTFWAMQRRSLVACPISHRFPVAKREQIVTQINATWLEMIEPGGTVRQHADAGQNDRTPNQPATLILTSGSSGKPKAVVHSVDAHIASAKGAESQIALGPGDRWLWSLPLCHVSGLSILIRCAVAGATVVGLQSESTFNASLLAEHRVTHLSAVSTQIRRLLAEEDFPSPHLKSVLLGGSGVDPKLVSEARHRGVRLHTTYGLTETASQVTTSTATDDAAVSGRILPGRRVKLSATGEILVGGETLCLGYYLDGRIESVVDEGGWFPTGDLGRWTDDGQLIVKGRIDNQFISGGENIHPENIERAMMEAFGVDEVIVVPKPCETYGERPIAYVRGNLPADWPDQLRRSLQGYEIPTEILPWPSGSDSDIKPDRRKLIDQVSVRTNRNPL
ncbi:MAG: AMP-binding protein [Planctomycetota bacterium]